jgi:hypothetical protein
MRDLLNKLTLFESTQEGFDPEEFKGEIEDFEVSGDDGEPEGADIHYTAKIVDGKPVVDPKSIEVHAYGNNPSSKLGYDVQNDTDMIMNYGGVDAEEILRSAQEDAEEQWAERDNKYSQGENVGEEMDPEVSDEMGNKINAWIEKYSKYEGGYGNLPQGYVKWALDSGIATDFIEQNEDEAMEEKYGDAYLNDPWDLKFYNQMPITKACMEELEKITGDTDIDHNARIIDKVMHGDGNESTNEDGMARGIGTLDKFRELYRKGIGSDDDEVVLRELIEVINDDALFADEFPELKAFTSASEFDDSEIVTAKDVPGDTADEKIESLIKAIDDDEWVESFVITLMKDFNIDGGENEELDRIKELSGVVTNEEALSKCCDAPISDGPGDAEGRCTSCGEVVNVDEQTFEGEEFYEYYGYLPWHEDIVDEAEYQGRKVKLGKPMQGDVKKFKVYVRDPKTKNIKKVNFGDPNMRIKKSNPKRRKSFRARHNCANPGPRTKARYWSCRKW